MADTPVILRGRTYADWSHRGLISVSNPSATAGFQAKITVAWKTGMNSDFSDIRFSDKFGKAISYWIESKTDGSTADIWVALPADDTYIYLFYGNGSATDAGDGDTVFELFDDFNRANSATVGNGWTESGDAQILDNNLYAADTASYAYKTFDFSAGSFEAVASMKSTAHARSLYMDMRDGTERALVAFSLYTSAPNNDALISYNPDTSLVDPYSTSAYYRVSIKRNGANDYDIDIDNGSVTQSGYDPSTSTTDKRLYLHLANDSGSAGYVDWIFVKKSATTEPTLSITITSINPNYPHIVIIPEDVAGAPKIIPEQLGLHPIGGLY